MSTFIGQLVGFAVIVWLVWRYVVPPVRKLMVDRQNVVRQQLDDSAAAADRLAEASQAHSKAKQRRQGGGGADHRRGAAQTPNALPNNCGPRPTAKSSAIKVQGAKQVELLRAQLVRQLRQEFGGESVRRAGELVRGYVADTAQQSATVDRFLDDLDAMAPSEADVQYPLCGEDALGQPAGAGPALMKRFGEIAKDLDDQGLSTLADELTSVAAMFDTRNRRHPVSHVAG